MSGCDEDTNADVAVVKLGSRTFHLEVAATPEKRFRGLSNRTFIEPDGGMLFVFPDRQVQVHSFVMRDCPIPIDIVYLDKAGRITAMHKMTPEPPRTDAEKQLSAPYEGAPDWTWTNDQYEDRLKRYPSRFASQFVIELAGNTLDSLDLKEGQKVEIDVAGLKALAN